MVASRRGRLGGGVIVVARPGGGGVASAVEGTLWAVVGIDAALGW